MRARHGQGLPVAPLLSVRQPRLARMMLELVRVLMTLRNDDVDDADLHATRGGRIDPLRVQEGGFDADARIDQAIAESFPASDPPSWNAGVDETPNAAGDGDVPDSRGGISQMDEQRSSR